MLDCNQQGRVYRIPVAMVGIENVSAETPVMLKYVASLFNENYEFNMNEELKANILKYLSGFGSIFLGIIAILPVLPKVIECLLLKLGTTMPEFVDILLDVFSNVSFGGTAILIVVSVALESIKQLESQMMVRHYKGFLD